ncbi:MAG: CatB-related O-acetyltransferase [Pseudomonas kermanshahensis]|jgi:acetyltransferase-like isoleucine patch superfamily enzyme|uniref:CatB-related O-acetyltransferase n=1 Tax=Pseudomonas kermanshahensis TaxID=2745482 RepID=UPI003D13F8F2
MKHAIEYRYLKDFLRERRVSFQVKDWSDRHKDSDLIVFHDDLEVEENAAFPVSGNAISSLGAFSYLRSAFLPKSRIGRYCSIAPRVTFVGGRHPYEWVTTSLFAYGDNVAIYDERDYPAVKRPSKPEKVTVGHDVWIGENVVLGRNITIGHGAVIAGGSVVVKDVQPYEIVGGNPARHIKYRFPEGIRNLLLESSWWRFHLKDFAGMDITSPESFAKEVIKRESNGDIQPYWPVVTKASELVELIPSKV